MRHLVHFNPSNGEVFQVAGAAEVFEIEGYSVAEMVGVTYWDVSVTPMKWRVELGSVQKRSGDVPTCTMVKVG